MNTGPGKPAFENPPAYGYSAPSGTGVAAPAPYPSAYPHRNVTVVQPARGPPPTTVIIPLAASLGSLSQRMRCPYCNADITTSVRYLESTKTHIIALLLCVIGCWPCCLIPYCMDDCKDTEHSCPNCRKHIGQFRR